MGVHTVSPSFETAIWTRLKAHKGTISADAARYFLSIKFTDADDGMQILMDKASESELTPAEDSEFDSYIHVVNVLSLIHSKSG